MATDEARQTQTAIIGAGVMGETLLSGLVRAGRRVDRLLVGEKRPERARELEERYGVAVVANVEAAAKADTLALVVKPQDMAEVLDEIAGVLRPGQLLVSLAAGITTAFIESHVPEGVAVVRVMPNTPATIGQGVAALSAGSAATAEHLDLVERLLSGTGLVVRVPEHQQSIVTAISGSGPAYVFHLIDALAEAGTAGGLPRDLALRLAAHTVAGSGAYAVESGTHPALLREAVSSPGGTTLAALEVLDERAVRAAYAAAARAAARRSDELSAQLGRQAGTDA
jgi:pyrroline-5-carboxylate reductase